ncbi:MAG: DNA methyltransferase [Planctomycetota bacterium]
MNTLPIHPAADLFPPMTAEEYAALKADIAANGQREPIALLGGKIVDGRHRYRACTELGIEPRVVHLPDDEDIVSYVTSANLHRRHLTASQRAAVAVQADAMRDAEADGNRRKRKAASLAGKVSGAVRRGEPNDVVKIPLRLTRKSRDDVAGQFNVSPSYIQSAKSIRDTAPDLLGKVMAGALTLPQARQELGRREKRADIEAKAAAAPATQADWVVHNGDCLAILPTLAAPARLIFADPPYNIGIDYGSGPAADKLAPDVYMAWAERWLAACRDRLTPDGSLWVLIGDEFAAEYGVTLKRLGFTIRSWVKWFEAFGVNCSNNFNRCSRHLFYCVRDPGCYVFHADAVSRPSDRQTKYADRRAAPGGKFWDDVWGIEPAIPRLTGTCGERVPDFPTQLPLRLLEPIVLCASDPGDLVVDPFNGSGTTGVASIRHGRRYVGIEQNPHFAELARLRLHANTRGPHVSGVTHATAPRE